MCLNASRQRLSVPMVRYMLIPNSLAACSTPLCTDSSWSNFGMCPQDVAISWGTAFSDGVVPCRDEKAIQHFPYHQPDSCRQAESCSWILRQRRRLDQFRLLEGLDPHHERPRVQMSDQHGLDHTTTPRRMGYPWYVFSRSREGLFEEDVVD